MKFGQPTLFLALTLLLCAATNAHKIYQGRIPNGDFVPHPCWPGFTWHGVGHENRMGSGERNPFGKDFEENGFKWDECLCQRDSDGDGMTNGQELGDPDCVWVEGTLPAGDSTSHPGVCEPLDDPKCISKNTWDLCTKPAKFECESLNTTTDVRVLEVTLPEKTPVPADKTTYMCQTFPVPDDDEFHLIAYEPLIDNDYVTYHIVLHGCPDDMEVDDGPRPCDEHPGEEDDLCVPILAPWAIGHLGNCFADSYGFRLGKMGFRRVMLQVHWNNPTQWPSYVDNSGLKLYYTTELRPNDAGTLRMGQTLLVIPPGEDKVVQSGYCDGRCMNDVGKSFFLTTAMIHTHYLGTGGSLSLKRDGKFTTIISDTGITYDTQKIHNLDEPVEVKPDDTLVLECTYQSKTRTEITNYGQGAYDEFCMAFITYYSSSEILNQCMNYGTGVYCPTHESDLPEMTGDCNFDKFFYGDWYMGTSMEIIKACGSEECVTACKDITVKTRREEVCLRDWVAAIIEPIITEHSTLEHHKEAIRLLHTCDDELIYANGPRKNDTPKESEEDDEDSCPFTSGVSAFGPWGLGSFFMIAGVVFIHCTRF